MVNNQKHTHTHKNLVEVEGEDQEGGHISDLHTIQDIILQKAFL